MSLDPIPSEGYNPAPMGRTLPKPPPEDSPDPAVPSVGSRIRAARERAGLSQSAAAARMPGEVRPQYWSDVENGRRAPSLEWLWEAARAIGCNPNKLDDRLKSVRPKKPE